MSLFEKLKNKRHNLTEQPGGSGFTDKQQADTNKLLNKLFGDKGKSRRTAKKAIGGSPTMNPTPDDVAKEKSIRRKQKKIEKTLKTTGDKPKSTLDNMAKNIAQQDIEAEGGKFKQPVSGTSQAKDFKPEPGSQKLANTTKGGPVKITKTKPVKQSEVSKKAKDFTNEINKKNKNLKKAFFDPKDRPTGEVPKTTKPKTGTGEGKVKYPKNRRDLIAKRKEYGIDRKGNISKSGVEKYARNMKRSNLPLTKKELSTAKQFAVGGKKIKDSTGKVVGTTTGKYGGKLGRRRNKNMKTYDQIKKDIDLKDLQKASDAKARKIARSQELKDLTKKMGEKELQQRVSQQATLKSIRPQRQFYKGAMKPARVITKAFAGPSGKVAPVVKTGLKVAAKAGPVGAIAAGTGLALLNPSIRKTAKKVAKAALGAAGIKAFTSKPKLVKRPPSKIGINLSPKA